MIKFLSLWSKSLGVAIVVVSILEMLLPNNKTKKYIRMVMGIFIIFNIISPFVNNKEIFNLNQINLDNYSTTETSSEINQKSMDERIKQLYIEELEKDITKKISEKGYEISKCKVDVQISDKEEETKIKKIKLNIKKSNDIETKNKEEKIENKVVTEIQKIKKVDTSINKESTNQEENSNNEKEKKINKSDIQNVKKFLIEEYGVNEKCLEIN